MRRVRALVVTRAPVSGPTSWHGGAHKQDDSATQRWPVMTLGPTMTSDGGSPARRSREYGTKGGRNDDESLRRQEYCWQCHPTSSGRQRGCRTMFTVQLRRPCGLAVRGWRVEWIPGDGGSAVHELGRLSANGRLHKAIQVVEIMHQEGHPISESVLYSLLQECSRFKDLSAGRKMHFVLVRCGFESNTLLQSYLIRMFVSCQSLSDANYTFRNLKAPGALTWAAIISANSKHGQGEETINLYHQMLQSGLKPNDNVYVAVLHACANLGALSQGKLIHAHVRRNGYDCNVYVSNTLIDMYAKCGSLKEAREVFDCLPSKDLVSWNSMIAGYAQSGLGDSAFQLFEQLLQNGVYPDKVTFICLLKTCHTPGALSQGKLTHVRAKELGFDSDLVVGTALIDMYSKCGSLEDSCEVFDRLPARDLMLWSAMIAAYVRHGQGQMAIQFFHQMQQEQLYPSKFILASVLQACTSLGALDQGKLIHACVIEIGCESDVLIGNTLINLYATCGSLDSAYDVFDKMPTRDLVTWNTMIAVYANNGLCQNALHLFEQMQRQQGLHPDEVTFLSAVKACSCIAAVDEGKRLHVEIRRNGFDQNLVIKNALVDMYAKCGCLEDARRMFDSMQTKDLVSWTAMIGAYAVHENGLETFQLFQEMLHEGLLPNMVTFLSVLKACTSTKDLVRGKLVHEHITRSKLETDVFVANTLINMYAKCGSLPDARKVFDELAGKDHVSWNNMIAGYAEHEQSEDAIHLFHKMLSHGMQSNQFTLVSVLQACSSIAALDQGRLVHRKVTERGLDLDVFIGSTLIHMYAKCGSLEDARRVFDKLSTRNLVTWNTLIAGYADCCDGEEALNLWKKMKEEDVCPDEVTLVAVLNACSSLTALQQGKEVHNFVKALGLEPKLVVGNALIDMYAKCGSMTDAHSVFDQLATKDLVSWTALIKGYTQHDDPQEALHLFQRTLEMGLQPDEVIYVSVLQACSSLAALDQGKQIHAQLTKLGFLTDTFVASSLMDMYAKCGSLVDAMSVFSRLPRKSLVSWNTIIGGCAQHGHGREALKLFKLMQREGFEPNDVTFVSLLSACSHAGLLDEGQEIFQSMIDDFGIIPEMKHYACMIDVLGRAGHLLHAHDLVDQMPSVPDVAVWMSLLGACRTHGNVDLGQWAFQSVVKKDPTNAAAYVLMSNIYESAGMWEEGLQVKQMMHSAGAKKDAGRSWIELDGLVHTFSVEDKTHPDRRQIYAALKTYFNPF